MTTTYGPQHPQVVALIGRAHRLTLDEARALAAARDAAADAAVDAVDAAWAAAVAAVAAARAAEAAAVAAAVDAAVAAAVDAALALATRHLIGTHGLTAEHYAILTRPWRTVIGPIHPDDPALAETIEETP